MRIDNGVCKASQSTSSVDFRDTILPGVYVLDDIPRGHVPRDPGSYLRPGDASAPRRAARSGSFKGSTQMLRKNALPVLALADLGLSTLNRAGLY